MQLLTVNAGSTSVRLVAYRIDRGEPIEIARQRSADSSLVPEAALAAFVGTHRLEAVGRVVHRIVHGGERLAGPCVIDADVRAEIERLAVLAPLHQPVALRWVDACARALPEARQMAVFDTAFYAELPAVARGYALPPRFSRDYGLRRYGFHGIAHRAMWNRWTAAAGRRTGRIISLQLGGGCSITATADGRPLDTSMGFSPLEGLVMATRCGDLDPGAVLHLQRTGMSIDALDTLLNRQSGLLGISGESSSAGELLASNSPAARHALALYCYRIRRYIGSYLAVLGGADAVLFGGGVGEQLPAIRAMILQGLQWAGLRLDPDANAAAIGVDARIDAAESAIEVRVCPVDEAALLARDALALPGASG